jgi:hypothetical protein
MPGGRKYPASRFPQDDESGSPCRAYVLRIAHTVIANRMSWILPCEAAPRLRKSGRISVHLNKCGALSLTRFTGNLGRRIANQTADGAPDVTGTPHTSPSTLYSLALPSASCLDVEALNGGPEWHWCPSLQFHEERSARCFSYGFCCADHLSLLQGSPPPDSRLGRSPFPAVLILADRGEEPSGGSAGFLALYDRERKLATSRQRAGELA